MSTPSEETTTKMPTPTPLDSHICYCYENCACEDDYLTEHLIVMNMPLSDLWNVEFKEFLSLKTITLSCDNAEDLIALLLSGVVSDIAYGVEIPVIGVDTSYSSGRRFQEEGILVINLPRMNVLTVGSNLFNNCHFIDLGNVNTDFKLRIAGSNSFMGVTEVVVYSKDEGIGEEMGVVIGRVNGNTVGIILKDLSHTPTSSVVCEEGEVELSLERTYADWGYDEQFMMVYE